MTITKFSKAFLYVAMVLAVVFTVVFFMGLDGTDKPNEQNIGAAGPYLSFAYALTFAAILLVLIFAIINIFVNPANLKKALLGIVGVIVVVGLAYMLSSDAPLNFTSKEVATQYNNDSSTLKWSDAGLYTAYILFGVAIIGALYTELKDFFKR